MKQTSKVRYICPKCGAQIPQMKVWHYLNMGECPKCGIVREVIVKQK